MNLREAIQDYMDGNYLVQPKLNPDLGCSGNGLLYTSEYILTLKQLGQLTDIDKWKYISAIKQCEIQPGLFERNPIAFKQDQESVDDHYGLAVGSLIVDPTIAQRILKYGRENKVSFKSILQDYSIKASYGIVSDLAKVLAFLFGWIKVKYNYNNINPGVGTAASWLGRQSQLICCLQYAAGEKPAFWRVIYTAVSIALSGKVGNNDSWILSSLVVYCSKSSWLCRKAANIWRKRLYKYYPKGVAQVLKSYMYPVDHPLAETFITP